jgi:FAD binding domain/Berberine and berberine like
MRNVHELSSALRGRFSGELLHPGDHGFEESRRIWNSLVMRTPGLIARCTSVADVQIAVKTAKTLGVTTAIRCGGHSLAGFSTCDGGLVIDLCNMRDVSVDTAHRRARLSGGCLLGTIDSATQVVGLAFPAGVVSHTGASGLILGGGVGWLTRLHGLSCDNVEVFTVVVADGSVVRASSRENEELFWALRGGGGNFGIVTEFEVNLHPISSALVASGLWAGDDLIRIIRSWREWMPVAPSELKWNLNLRLAPESENVAPKLRGRPVASGTAVWFGDRDKGIPHLKRILSVGKPTAVTQAVVSYLSLQSMADRDFPHGRRYYTKSGYFNRFDDTSILLLAKALDSIPSPTTQIELAYLGGAAARVGPSETAFGDRGAAFILNLLADWSEPAEDAANIEWIRKLFDSLRPAMKPGVYVNFMSGDEEGRTREAYQDRWGRLVAVKTHYDPDNFFRRNQNIPPAG